MSEADVPMRAHTASFVDAYQRPHQPYEAQNGLIFGVGLLIGGGWPGAAADVAHAAESAFPGRAVWPWTHAPPKPS